jgi:hypothetical protein
VALSRGKFWLIYGWLLLGMSWSCGLGEGQIRRLAAGPSPIGNPLQGWVPYADPAPNRFPHSLEFSYLGLGRIVQGPGVYNWTDLDALLDAIATRGNQAVVRFYLEYPGKRDGIPDYLRQQGLTVHQYLNTNTAPFPPQEVHTPDYEDPNLRKMLVDFVQQFGQRYDGDARLGYVTAGLLGTWGEWHTYPRNDLWASQRTQREVLEAYEQSFRLTPILLRYPAGDRHGTLAENASRPFGYHDDSLCWATLPTGRSEDDWFFLPALRAAGPAAVAKWERHPIGGEIRPEVWGQIFDDPVPHPQAQSFAACAAALHLTWAMDTGMFREPPPPERMERALREVAKLGYEFHVPECDFAAPAPGSPMSVTIQFVNRGIAPMYHRWPLELSVADPTGQVVQVWDFPDHHLAGLLPSETGQRLNFQLDLTNLPAGEYRLLLRVVNPLENGKPLQFANRDWGTVRPDRLTLGQFTK